MCGIAGCIDFSRTTTNSFLSSTVRGMTDRLTHRGPDESGIWVDAPSGVALGHRRLSILDLSPAGHQPMFSGSGRFVTVFNGEIYNFQDLRMELEEKAAIRGWVGHSDTEVLLAAISEWGFEASIKKVVGMFALAVFDRLEKRLFLARDRVGEKPLYYGFVGKQLLFGSELKAFRGHPDWRGEVDRSSLALMLKFSCIPAPSAIFKGIFKVVPGTYLSFRVSPEDVPVDCSGPQEKNRTVYWSPREVFQSSRRIPFGGSDQEGVETLDRLLRDSVKGQMVSDVPLGAFLSGGVDSSTVVALMQAQSSRPVRTFTIGFHETHFNEAPFAKAVAQHLGTEHTELYVSPQDALDVIPRLPMIYDEPFSDSSQVPTFLVSEMTRKHVTVSLSGDGGDELFAGYPRYLLTRKIWDILGKVPLAVRGLGSKVIRRVPVKLLNQAPPVFMKFLSQHGGLGEVGDKLHKLAEVMTFDTFETLYEYVVSTWKNPLKPVLGAGPRETVFSSTIGESLSPDVIERMMFLDLLCYLPDDLLVKVDRAGMAVSLETRMPFLDHRVVEYAWNIPLSMKIRAGKGKWLLREVLYKYVPRELIDRKKMGFSIPLGDWLSGPLREWVESLLNRDRLAREGFFEPSEIRRKWMEHLAGVKNWQYQLWDVLMFQAWLENQSRHDLLS